MQVGEGVDPGREGGPRFMAQGIAVQHRIVSRDIRGFDTTKAKRRVPSGANQSPARNSRRPTLSSRAFSRATAKAAGDRSIAVTGQSGRSTAIARAMAPDPVPRSNVEAEVAVERHQASPVMSARATSVSVSGRGTSTAGPTRSGNDQNSRSPQR